MVRVKICANKKKEDALKAVELGADAVGFLVGQTHESNDFIDANLAREMVEILPPFVSSVLVTHVRGGKEIVELARQTNVTTIQLHGDSTEADIKTIRENLPNVKLYKTVHVTDDSSVNDAKRWEGVVDAILLDSANLATNQIGGTGKTHNWEVSAKIIKELNLPVILAGGLNPDNVKEAIEKVKPYGVDVNSGTKGKDGFKDYNKLKSFIKKAKEV